MELDAHDREVQRARELLDSVAVYLAGVEWDVEVAVSCLRLALQAVDELQRGDAG